MNRNVSSFKYACRCCDETPWCTPSSHAFRFEKMRCTSGSAPREVPGLLIVLEFDSQNEGSRSDDD